MWLVAAGKAAQVPTMVTLLSWPDFRTVASARSIEAPAELPAVRGSAEAVRRRALVTSLAFALALASSFSFTFSSSFSSLLLSSLILSTFSRLVSFSLSSFLIFLGHVVRLRSG